MFNFIFVMAIGTIEQVGLIDIEDHAVNQMFEDYSPMIIVLFAVILAPFFEELIFRAPLTLFCKYKKAFRWIFYAFALIFGYVHITNYELTTNVLLFSPILVGPQIILGLFLGVIRVKLGLIYAMFFHAFYNGILVIPSVLFQFLT
jgi:membrane protease YdiL (CAAX protease family)